MIVDHSTIQQVPFVALIALPIKYYSWILSWANIFECGQIRRQYNIYHISTRHQRLYSFPVSHCYKMEQAKLQRELKRRATGLDKPISHKTPRINIGNNAECQCTLCQGLKQDFVKKKSMRKDGLYQFVLWRENLRVQRANALQPLFQYYCFT